MISPLNPEVQKREGIYIFEQSVKFGTCLNYEDTFVSELFAKIFTAEILMAKESALFILILYPGNTNNSIAHRPLQLLQNLHKLDRYLPIFIISK